MTGFATEIDLETLQKLRFRDPVNFRAGEVHNCYHQWHDIITHLWNISGIIRRVSHSPIL